MSNPNPETPPPSANSPGQPWAQIGLLSLNVALLMVGLGDLLFWMGIPFRETTQTMSGLLFLAGLTIYVMSPKRRVGQETVPYSLRLHWLNLGTFGGAVTMILLSLIIPAAQAAQRAVEDREKTIETEMNPDTWRTVRSERSGFVVDIPPNWEESKDPTQRANDVCQIDVANDLLFFMLSVPKEDITFESLESWAEATLKNLSESFEEWEVIERSSSAVPGPPAIELLLECTKENTRLIFFMRFLDTPNHYLWVRAAATRSGFREHEETLRRMVRSVRRE